MFVDADLAQLASLSRDDWDAATRGSAVRRAGYEGLLRNVAVALGNTRSADAVPALVGLLANRESLVRSHAVWALGQIDHQDARAPPVC
jgi:epoxyqueuosine reductase